MDEMLFESARLKLKRANEHIVNLEDVLNRIDTDYYRVVINKDADSDSPVVVIQCITNPSGEISLLVGDIVHNLRSALDHLMCELIALCGGTCTKDVAFLFGETRNKLVTSINNGKIKALGKDMVDLIVDVVKPYKGGNDALYSLSELDNIDKHRLLIAIFSFARFDGLPVGISADGVAHFIGIRSQKGVEEFVFSDKPLEVDNDIEFAMHVTFGKGQPFEHKSVLPTLQSLSQIVSGVIQNFEKAYLART